MTKIVKIPTNSDENIKSLNTSPYFDLSRSLKESPPMYKKYKGVRFIKRIIVARDNIDWDQKYQPKINIYDQHGVANIKNSYETHGFLYREDVQIVTPSKTSSKEFEGIGGFKRNEGQELLGWTHTIVDVVEFDSDLDRRIFSFQTNHIYAPRMGNTKTDIMYGIDQAIKFDGLDRTDDNAIISFIERVAADKTKAERETIFRNFRKQHSVFENMKPLDGNLANSLAKKLNLQYSGNKNRNVDGIAYVKSSGNSKTLYWDGMKKSLEHGGSEITVYGYIEEPKPKQLKIDRIKWLKQFEELKEFHYLIVAQSTDRDIQDVRDNTWCPFKFGGFLPQNITPVGSDAQPTETTLVDENGKSII